MRDKEDKISDKADYSPPEHRIYFVKISVSQLKKFIKWLREKL
jgi:hypothetical protein